MLVTLHSSRGRGEALIAGPETLLTLPPAKASRHATDWPETDGIDYDLSEPIQLEPLTATLLVRGDIPQLGETIRLEGFGQNFSATVLSAAPLAPHSGWTELQLELEELTKLFGAGRAKPEGKLSDSELLKMGVRFVPDLQALAAPPRAKLALNESEQHESGRRIALAAGRAARSIKAEVWIRSPKAVERYLSLCRALVQHTAGGFEIRGKTYWLRYQRMSLDELTPSFVRLQLQLQQWRY